MSGSESWSSRWNWVGLGRARSLKVLEISLEVKVNSVRTWTESLLSLQWLSELTGHSCLSCLSLFSPQTKYLFYTLLLIFPSIPFLSFSPITKKNFQTKNKALHCSRKGQNCTFRFIRISDHSTDYSSSFNFFPPQFHK